jgi:hypothetical protein
MAIVIPVISTFDSKGVNKAISSFRQLDGAGQKSAFALLNSTKAINSFGKSVVKIGAIMGGIGGVVGGSLIKAALESQKVAKQTEAIVKATGGAANLSTQEISELARVMSVKTGVDDEAIQTSMNLLLTFKQVRNEVGAGNDVFTRASAAALDLGNVFGSTDGAAKQLGKALSDPVKGISALRKAGINFTDSQKEQIKTLVESGRTLDAQKLILAEVESQVGGTAAATATDFDRMKVAVGNVAEDLGTLLLPAFENAAKFVTENLVPIFKTFSDIIGEKGLGAGFKYLGEQGLQALGKMNGFGDVVYGIVTGVIALNVATGIYTVAQTIATIAMSAFGSATTKAAIATTGLAVAMNAAFFGIPALIGAVVVIIASLALRFKGFRDVLGKMIPVLKYVINFFLDAFVNPFVYGINLLIKAYNGIPFLSDIPLLTNLEIGSKKAKTEVQSLSDELTKLKPKLKLTAGAVLPKPKTTKTTGGGGDTTIDKAKTALEKYTSALKLFGSETKAYKDAVKGVATANESLTSATDKLREAQDKFNKISKGYGAGSKEAAVATRDLADANRSAVRATLSLRDATRSVADAQKELDDLKSGKAVTEAEGELASATQKVANAQAEVVRARKSMRTSAIVRAEEALEKALDEQGTAQEKVNDARALATPEAIQTAEEKLTTAILDQEDAQIALKDAQQAVLDKQKELNEIVNGAATDSEKYKDAQKELTDAQKAERDATDDLADAYDRQAESARLLKKAKDDLAVAARATTSKQERDAQIATGINPDTGLLFTAGSGGGSASSGNGFSGGMMVLPSIDFSNLDFSGIDFSGIDFSNIFAGPFMANGGVVNKPTLAMIGESGSEAVVPLDRLNTGGDVYNITINSKIADNTLPDLLVAELRKFNRRSGAIDIQVS